MWAPQNLRLWLRALGWGVPSLGLVGLFFSHAELPLLPLGLICAMFAVVCLVGAQLTLNWPRHLAADDAGIAIATWGSGYTLRWDDLLAIEKRCTALCQPYLALHTEERMYLIELTGYSKQMQADILKVILSSAGLDPDPHTTLLWARPLSIAAPTGTVKPRAPIAPWRHQ